MQKVNVKRSLNYLILSLSSALFTHTSMANDSNNLNNYATNLSSSNIEQVQNEKQFTDAQLAQMLAPIALYPDTLLSHILIATTYPIEVVDAERWLNKNQNLSAQQIADAAEEQDWDPSIKALLPFPNILKKLSEDLHWMRSLGDAFLEDEAQVLASVQALRQKADQAGNLENMDNVKVVRETQTIIIEPRESNIIYVPYYDTRVVYGRWGWSHYPPVYWHQPIHFAHHHGPYYWHNPVHLSIGLFFGAVHWSNHHVVVHHHKSRYYKRHSNKKVSRSYQAQRWQHNPNRRRGVAYRTTHTQKKYRSHTPSVQQHKVVRAQQKHQLNNHKNFNKLSSHKQQDLKHKLQVNRAVKIDKHRENINAHAKTKAVDNKNSKWRQNEKDNKRNARTVNNTNYRGDKTKQYVDKHNTAKERLNSDRHTQRNPEPKDFKNSPSVITEKNYSKNISSPKPDYKESRRATKTKRVDRRSKPKANSHKNTRSTRAQRGREKQHN